MIERGVRLEASARSRWGEAPSPSVLPVSSGSTPRTPLSPGMRIDEPGGVEAGGAERRRRAEAVYQVRLPSSTGKEGRGRSLPGTEASFPDMGLELTRYKSQYSKLSAFYMALIGRPGAKNGGIIPPPCIGGYAGNSPLPTPLEALSINTLHEPHSLINYTPYPL